MVAATLCPRSRGRSAFTLVELLVVIAIIGVLVGLLLPAVQAAREASRRSQCLNNLKQIGLGFHLHHDVHQKFPAGAVGVNTAGDAEAAEALWALYILPYIEQSAIFESADLTRGFGMGQTTHPNYLSHSSTISTFQCPSNASDVDKWLGAFARRSYSTNNGVGPGREGWNSQSTLRSKKLKGVFFMNSKTRFADFLDGSSNTVAAAEVLNVHADGGVSDQRGAWYPEGAYYHHNYTPNDQTPDQTRSGHCVSTEKAPCIGSFSSFADRQLISTTRSNHPGGVNVLMGDGSVNFVADTVALNVWQAAGTPSSIDGEIVFSGF